MYHSLFQEANWDCTVALHMPELYKGTLEKHPQKVTYNPNTKNVTISDLQISKPGRYFLKFDCKSATGTHQYFVGNVIDIFPVGYVKPTIVVVKQV